MSNLTSGPVTWSWDPVGWWRTLHDRVSRVPACKTSPRAKLESDATDGAWYSTTALLSGRDRPRRLCVLRLSGSDVLGVQESSDLPPEQQPPRGARRECGARPLSTANVVGCINTLICPTSIEHSASITYVVHGQRSVGGSPA